MILIRIYLLLLTVFTFTVEVDCTLLQLLHWYKLQEHS